MVGFQFLQLELRLGKISSRSFRPVKSASEIFFLWQFWASSSFFGVALAHAGFLELSRSPLCGVLCFAIGERHLLLESIIACRSTDVIGGTSTEGS
ncbi:hypothetical protein Tco_0343091 [Tanacetum coccineum]